MNSRFALARRHLHFLRKAPTLRRNLSYWKFYTRAIRYMVPELIANGHFSIRDAQGNCYLTPTNNFTSFATHLHGARDPNILKFLEHNVPTGDAAFDVGANIGTYALPLARLVGDLGVVVAYEADPEMCHCLYQNVLTARTKNVVVRCAAAGAKGDLLTVERNLVNRGETSVKRVTKYVGLCVNSVSIDDERIALAGGRRVAVLKIDVEGFEGMVLQGARKLLADNPTVTVVMEHLPETASRSDGDFSAVRILEEFGFRPFQVSNEGKLHPSESGFGANLVWKRVE